MNSKNRFFAIAPIAIGVVLSMSLGACSTAADMDEVIDSTELGAPAPSNGDLGGGGDDVPPSGD